MGTEWYESYLVDKTNVTMNESVLTGDSLCFINLFKRPTKPKGLTRLGLVLCNIDLLKIR